MYLLFAGDYYYPNGGMGDYIGSYDTEEEAQLAGAEYEWSHVAIGSIDSVEAV